MSSLSTYCGESDDQSQWSVASPEIPLENCNYSSSSQSPPQRVPEQSCRLAKLMHYSGISTSDSPGLPYLKILEQPQNFHKFRYISEMDNSHGCIYGKTYEQDKTLSKTYPEVELVNYEGKALIKCELVEINKDSKHPHQLVVGEKEVKAVEVSGKEACKVRFPSLCIIYTAQKKVKQWLIDELNTEDMSPKMREATYKDCENMAKKIDLHRVRLKFSAIDSHSGAKVCEPVFSEPIKNLKNPGTNILKICRMSRCSGNARGGDDVIMLVEKVVKKNIEIWFFEKSANGKEVLWRQKALFSESDVHHQYAIAFRTPPYKDKHIRTKTPVWVELIRPTDGQRSEPKEFFYTPGPLLLSKKRKFSHNEYQQGASKTNIDPPQREPTQLLSVAGQSPAQNYAQMSTTNMLPGPSEPTSVISNPAQTIGFQQGDNEAWVHSTFAETGQNTSQSSPIGPITTTHTLQPSGMLVSHSTQTVLTNALENEVHWLLPTSTQIGLDPSQSNAIGPITTTYSLQETDMLVNHPTQTVLTNAQENEVHWLLPTSTQTGPDISQSNGIGAITTSHATFPLVSEPSHINPEWQGNKGYMSHSSLPHVGTKTLENDLILQGNREDLIPHAGQSVSQNAVTMAVNDHYDDIPQFFNQLSGYINSPEAMFPELEDILFNLDTDSAMTPDSGGEKKTTVDSLYQTKAENIDDDPVITRKMAQQLKSLLKLIKVMEQTKENIIRKKLEQFFDMRLSNGENFLHLIVTSKQPLLDYLINLVHEHKMVHLLNLRNTAMQTILHLAVVNDLPDLIPKLLEKGCDPMLEDIDGNNVIHYAVIYDTCLEPLLDAIEKLNIPHDLDARNNEGQTALHLAVSYRNEENVKGLARRGGCGARDAAGRTALHVAAGDASLPLLAILLDYVHQNDIDKTDDRGYTVLQILCYQEIKEGVLDIIKVLLDNKADPVLRRKGYRTTAWSLVRDEPEVRALMRQYIDEDPVSDYDTESEDEFESASEGDVSDYQDELADITQPLDKLSIDWHPR